MASILNAIKIGLGLQLKESYNTHEGASVFGQTFREGIVKKDGFFSSLSNAWEAAKVGGTPEAITAKELAAKAAEEAKAAAVRVAPAVANAAGEPGMFSKMWSGVSNAAGWVAEKTGLSKYGSKISEFCKMPIVGAVVNLGLMAYGEVPKVTHAFKNYGFMAGLKQIGKSTVNVIGSQLGFTAGDMAGMAIGTAIFGPLGTIPGLIVGMVGGLVGSSVAGKITQKIVGDDIPDPTQQQQDNYPQFQRAV